MFNWVSFLTYAFVTVITPGPNNIMSMSNGNRKGFKKALPFNVGILIGFSVVIGVCTFFCSVLSALIPRIKLPMVVVGAAYMLYLAWETFRSSDSIAEDNIGRGLLSGVILQFVNPKLYLYSIISMEAYILPFYAGRLMLLLGFGILLSLMGFGATLCWSAFGSVFKPLFSTHAKIINTIMALLLVYCAISLFLS